MTKQEFINAITEIGQCETVEDMRERLTDLSTNTQADYDALETANNNVQSLTQDNENLRSANMKLFLKVGSNGDTHKDDETPDIPPKDKLKFADLFDEKGGIK